MASEECRLKGAGLTFSSSFREVTLLLSVTQGLASLRMDFCNLRLPLLILAALGKNVTFKTTITSTQDFLTITWNFNKNSVIAPIITSVLVTNTINIDKKYASRIIYSNTTCELQLGPLVKEDEGEYNLNIVTIRGESLSGQIDLEVLGSSL
uniref:Uncharacterized protein n=1 Tax=Cyprinus carpio carpio TaxID=630221 RepID=A0A9J7ZTM3_CYPCA